MAEMWQKRGRDVAEAWQTRLASHGLPRNRSSLNQEDWEAGRRTAQPDVRDGVGQANASVRQTCLDNTTHETLLHTGAW